MALLFMDGFDHYTGSVDTLGKWEAVTSVGSIDTGVARTGTGSLTMYYTNDEVVTRPFIATGGFIVGEAVRFNSIGAGNDFLRIKEDIIVHMALTVTATGIIQVKRGSTVLATGTLPVVQGTWNHIEFKGIIHATAGSFEVRVDSVTDPALTVSDVNTRNGGSGQWNRVSVISITAGAYNWVDDFYVCDTSGPAPRNDFLGPVHVETLYPQTDAVSVGSNAGWTPSISTDRGAMVDENPPNTTDYNASNVIGAKDTYQYPSLTFPGAVLGIQTNIFAQKTDTTGRQICAVVRSNNTDRDGAPSSLSSVAYTYASEIRAQNPTTSTDWTQADITALQAGVKVVA